MVEGEAVLPSRVEHLQIGLRDGLIAEMKRGGLRGKKIDGTGCLIFPGFIDPHVHLREPGWEEKEDFLTGSMAAIHGGVTTMCDMPNNRVPATSAEVLKRKGALADRAPIDIFFYAGVTKENLRELSSLSKFAIGYKIYLAESTGGLILDEDSLPRALQEISKTGKPASIHCEDEGLIESRQKASGRAEGARAHARVRNEATEIVSIKKVISAMNETGTKGRVNTCHVSTSEGCRLVARARRNGANVACEVTLHHIFFNRGALERQGSLLKVNPPLRLETNRLGLIRSLRKGEIDFLVTDHAPHTLAEKESADPPSGTTGLDNYANLVSWLIKKQGITPMHVARLTSGNQARFFGLMDRGAIAKGKRADIVVLDMKSPEKVKRESLRTKCGWSPYVGLEFPGRARWTIKNGNLVQEDGRILV